MNFPSQIQPLALQQLMEKGFASAAKTFSIMSGKEIGFSPSGMFLVHNSDVTTAWFQRGKKLNVLTTFLMGDLAGVSYLAFDEKDIRAMASFPSFSTLLNSDRSINYFFMEMLLKELDNILSANVITHLSNHTQVKILGDVPLFETKSVSEANEMANSYHPDEYKSVVFKTLFSCAQVPEFSPQFVWKLQPAILEIKSNLNKLILSKPYEITAEHYNLNK